MDEKLPIPCDGCRASGLRHGVVCNECQGKGYRLVVNGKPLPAKYRHQQPRRHSGPAKAFGPNR